MCKQLSLVAIFLFSLLISPTHTFAGTYGQSSYGKGVYSVGGSQSSDRSAGVQGSTTDTPVCNDQTPGTKSPWLYAATAQDGNSVLLYFTEADNPVTKYILRYGTKSGEYQYGVDNLGINERNQMTFLVQSLQPNTTYYFSIRAGNGCAVGSWSNELAAKTKDIISFNQLELSPEISTITTKLPKTKALLTPKKIPTINSQKESILAQGYSLNVKVLDTEQKPVKGAEVVLHSKTQKSVTNSLGVASFTNVEPGQHKVIIAYDSFVGEQSLNLNGSIKEVNLKITVEKKEVIFSFISLAIIFALSLLAGVLAVWIIRLKHNR